MKKRFICIAAAALMLAACADSSSVSDAGSSTAPDSTAESTVTADLSAEPVRSAYSGAEALFGMSFPGFEMPESFEVPLVERVYELSYNNDSGVNAAENSKKIFKRFFGERYDPSNELGNGSTGLMYRSKEQEIITEEQPDGSKAEIYAQDYGEIDNGFIILCDKQSYILSYHDSEFTRYRTATRGAELIETKAGEISVAQEASYIEKEVNELIGDAAAPFAVKVMFVDVYDIGKIAARCALTYDGGELPTRVGEIRGKITEDLNRSLLAVKSFEVDCKAEKDKVTAVVHGRVFNPVGIVKDMEFTVSDCMKRPDPVEFIRNVRRIKGLYDKGI